MSEEKIKITKEDSELTKFRKNLEGAKNDLLKLQAAGNASSKALDEAKNKVIQYGTALNKARKETNDLANANKSHTASLLNMGKNLTVVGAGIYGATRGMVAFGKAIFDATQDGADFAILLESFKKIGGTDADLSLMRIASAGNLTKEEMIKLSLANKQLGLTLQQTTSLLDKIEVQADETGFSFRDANESVKKFISSGATRGLVGFLEIPKLKEEVDKLNKSFTDSGKELTDVQEEANRTQAILNILSGTSGDLAGKQGDIADKMAGVSTSLQDLKKDAELALLQGLTPFINQLTSSPAEMEKFTQGIKDIGEGIGWTLTRLTNITNAISEFIFLLNNPSLKNFGDWVTLGPGQHLGWGEGGRGGGEVLPRLNQGGRGILLGTLANQGIRTDNGMASEAISMESRNVLEDTTAIYGAISQSMNLLNIGTDTFVGTLLSGFNTVLTIMESIKAVNSILNIIPGFAEGGVATGLFMAGERGAELINVGNNSARVYNNSDTMRLMNNFTNNAPAIYISSNINPEYINFVVGKKNAMETYTRR